MFVDGPLYKCIIKKSSSVTRYLFDEYAVPLSIGICAAVLCAAVVIIIGHFISHIASGMAFVVELALSLHPVAYLIGLPILAIVSYSTVWCIQRRKQQRYAKSIEDIDPCPIGELKITEKNEVE